MKKLHSIIVVVELIIKVYQLIKGQKTQEEVLVDLLFLLLITLLG